MNLHPFPGDSTPKIELRVTAEQVGSLLKLGFHLHDPAGVVAWPARVPKPERRDGLWQRTCFEAFFSTGSAEYWELNLSPSGDWNLYRFDAYREGMRAETRVSNPMITVNNRTLEATLDLERMAENAELSLGLAAVIEERDGRLSYWALHHSGERPDFHDAASRTLWLPRK